MNINLFNFVEFQYFRFFTRPTLQGERQAPFTLARGIVKNTSPISKNYMWFSMQMFQFNINLVNICTKFLISGSRPSLPHRISSVRQFRSSGYKACKSFVEVHCKTRQDKLHGRVRLRTARSFIPYLYPFLRIPRPGSLYRDRITFHRFFIWECEVLQSCCCWRG